MVSVYHCISISKYLLQSSRLSNKIKVKADGPFMTKTQILQFTLMDISPGKTFAKMYICIARKERNQI